jgi:hypothetical protein
MTKYCIMRECDNIHSWIPLSGDLVFRVISMELTVLNYPKGFWRSLPEISLFSQSSSSKDLITNPSVPFPFAFARLNALQAAVRHSLNGSSGDSSFGGNCGR